MSYDEISRQLGISMGKVKTDIRRGRETLAEKIKKFDRRRGTGPSFSAGSPLRPPAQLHGMYMNDEHDPLETLLHEQTARVARAARSREILLFPRSCNASAPKKKRFPGGKVRGWIGRAFRKSYPPFF